MTGPGFFSEEEGMEMRPLTRAKAPFRASRRMPPTPAERVHYSSGSVTIGTIDACGGSQENEYD